VIETALSLRSRYDRVNRNISRNTLRESHSLAKGDARRTSPFGKQRGFGPIGLGNWSLA
jgi:hypothetical protein